MDRTLTVGARVLFTLPEGPWRGETRPATVTHVHDGDRASLDWETDADRDGTPGIRWSALVHHDEAGAPGTWRWPPRE
jgi:hypothetical protein